MPCSSLSPEVLSAFGIVHSAKLTLEDWFFGRFRLSFEPCPCGRYQSPVPVDRIHVSLSLYGHVTATNQANRGHPWRKEP